MQAGRQGVRERKQGEGIHVRVLMRDEKEGRKKQARSNKQVKTTQHTQGSHFLPKINVHAELPW